MVLLRSEYMSMSTSLGIIWKQFLQPLMIFISYEKSICQLFISASSTLPKIGKNSTVKCIACYKVHSEKAKKAYSPLSNQEVKYSKWQGKKSNEIMLENDIL